MPNIEVRDKPLTISNPLDKLEIAVKQNLTEGENYKSWNVIYKTVGFGSLKGGEQKARAKEKLSQYALFTPTGRTKYEQCCEEIFAVPCYLEKADGRGKNGFYIDRLVPLILYSLLAYSKCVILTSIRKLAVQTSIVSPQYSKLPSDKKTLAELSKHKPVITKYSVNDFYNNCHEELTAIIYRTLDRLQDEYSLLDYEKTFLIKKVEKNPIDGTESEISSIANRQQRIIIRKAERIALNEMGLKSKRYLNDKYKDFRKRVCSIVSQECEFNMTAYYPQISIFFIPDLVRRFLEDHYPDYDYETVRNEIREHFRDTMQKKTVRLYNYKNKQLNECVDKEIEPYAKNEDIAELIELGVFDPDELREEIANRKRWEFRYSKPKNGEKPPYFYYPNFLEKQNYLISQFII